MAGCEQRDTCPFFQKSRSAGSSLHQVYAEDYCRGPFAKDCMRKIHREIYGEFPCDDLSPTGLLLRFGGSD
jgi:hypothetical protein